MKKKRNPIPNIFKNPTENPTEATIAANNTKNGYLFIDLNSKFFSSFCFVNL